jgi:hypothetical protein
MLRIREGKGFETSEYDRVVGDNARATSLDSFCRHSSSQIDRQQDRVLLPAQGIKRRFKEDCPAEFPVSQLDEMWKNDLGSAIPFLR